MSLDAGRVGVRADQVDVHGRITSPSFLNELLEDLPEWTDMPVWVNGTEELLPSDNSVPVTSPILADIAYPDIRRDNQYFTYRESPTPVDGLAKIKSIKGNTLIWNQLCCKQRYFSRGNNEWSNVYTENGVTFTYSDDYTIRITGTPTARAYIYANRLDNYNHPVKRGDKLLLRCSDVPNGIDIFSSLYNDSTWKGTGPQKSNKYVIVPSDVNKIICMGLDVQASLVGQPIDVTVKLSLFNLTQMFGSGNEPTEEEFNALFPLYYSYNVGTLLSFNGTGIKTANEDESEEHTTTLPISTYFPTGMKSADTAYDELTPAKATTRINASDMGSLPWTMPTSGIFQVYISDAHVRPKVLTPFFKYFNNNFTYGGAPNYEDGTGGTNPNNQNIYYKDSNFTSVDALKSAMSGVYLYYELATPVELPTLSLGE